MFSQADFPVSPSAMQEAEKERKMTATSGLKCYERFGRYSPLGSLLKTLLASRRWYNPAVSLKWDVQTFSSKKVLYVEKNTGTSSMPSVKTLSEKDMKSNRLLFQLVPQERPIEETGYGLLPTVQTQGLKRCNKKGKTEFLPLHLLPTPTAAEATKYTTKLNSKSQMGMGLTRSTRKAEARKTSFESLSREELVSLVGSVILGQKNHFDVTTPQQTSMWKERLRKDPSYTKQVLSSADVASQIIIQRIDILKKGGSQDIDLRSSTPVEVDIDGNGIVESQENLAPDQKQSSNESQEQSDEVPRQEKRHMHR